MIVNNIAIEIEGVDKSGKDTIAQYITTITNYMYAVNVRGTLTQLVYNDKFSRGHSYKILYKPLIVFLTVEEDDQKIRSIITKEPKINAGKDTDAYFRYIEELQKNDVVVIWFNTTYNTPFEIATKVKEYLDSCDEKDFIITEPFVIDSLNLYKKEDLINEDVYYEYAPNKKGN